MATSRGHPRGGMRQSVDAVMGAVEVRRWYTRRAAAQGTVSADDLWAKINKDFSHLSEPEREYIFQNSENQKSVFYRANSRPSGFYRNGL